MRIAETQRRSGVFWLSSDPDNRLPGTLEITDGGSIELNVVAASPAHLFKNRKNIPRIIGIVEKSGYVTLDRCFFTQQKIDGSGISKGRLRVHRAFVGVSFSEDEAVHFNEFRFSVEGLDDWLYQPGVRADADWAASTVSISYARPADVELTLPGGHRVTFSHAWTFKPDFNRASVTQKAHIRIRGAKPLTFEEATALAHKLVNFLCFAIDKTVTIDSASATVMATEEEQGPEKPVDIALFYPSLPFSEEAPATDPHRMLFSYSQVRDSAEKKLARWLSAYELFQPALALYFGARAGAHKYLNGRFLSLAQAIETYHRRTSNERFMDERTYKKLAAELKKACPKELRTWLSQRLRYGNEINLAARIKHIVKPFAHHLGDAKERKKLIRKMVVTRNYLTHYDNKLKADAAEGMDLYALCMSSEAILQLHLLKEIGFSDSEIDDIVARSDTLRAKLKGEPA